MWRSCWLAVAETNTIETTLSDSVNNFAHKSHGTRQTVVKKSLKRGLRRLTPQRKPPHQGGFRGSPHPKSEFNGNGVESVVLFNTPERGAKLEQPNQPPKTKTMMHFPYGTLYWHKKAFWLRHPSEQEQKTNGFRDTVSPGSPSKSSQGRSDSFSFNVTRSR